MTTFTTDDRIYAEKDGSFTIDCRQKPLTDAEIFALAIPTEIDGTDEEVLAFAREIERAHGIR